MEAGTPQAVRLEDLHVPGQLSGRKHILSILVENKPGVLARVAGLFSRRGFNIDTLAVGPTDDPSISRVTLTLDGAVHPIDQVTKQLHKLVNVLKIRDMEPEETVAREMALFKVSSAVENRAEIIQFAEIFRAKIVDVARRTMTIEVTGSADKIEAFERMVRPHGLVEMVRTGEIAIARGSDYDSLRTACARASRAAGAAGGRWSASPPRSTSPTPARPSSPRASPPIAGSAGSSPTASSPSPASVSPTRPPRAVRARFADVAERVPANRPRRGPRRAARAAGRGRAGLARRLRLRARWRRLLDLVLAGAGLAGPARALALPQRRAHLPHRQRGRRSRGRRSRRALAALGARLAGLRAEAPLPMLDPHPTAHAQIRSARPPGEFEAAVAAATDTDRGGGISKVVLAREVIVDAAAAHDPAALFGAMREQFPACFCFCCGTPEAAFIGASPELLVRRSGAGVSTVALAGSTRRSSDPAVDDHLGEQLLRSDKDRREQRIVSERIVRALRPHAVWVEAAPEPEIVKVANIQHLATPVIAQLADPRSAIELAGMLHPTPAVGGEPWPAAAAAIAELEGMDRGWYAGPVGWMDATEDGEFCVALRSALLRDREAHLFAGVGVVAGSDPAAELAETEVKLGALLPLLAE